MVEMEVGLSVSPAVVCMIAVCFNDASFWHPCPYLRGTRTSAGGCLLHILFVFSPGFLHLASLPETQAWILWLYIFLSRIPVSSFPLLRLMIPKKYQSAPN